MQLTIAENCLDTPRCEGVCTCGPTPAAGGSTSLVLWAAPSDAAPDTRVLCAYCGHLRKVTTRPVVPLAGEQWPLRTARVSSPALPTWSPCRHFHREAGETHAVRHRWSGLHSFRTIVCGEWVVRGSVTYELHFPRLDAPCAVGIGVVNPRAAVNSDIAWWGTAG